MRQLSILFAASATPAWSHQHQINFDIICSSSDSIPGLSLVPFLLLVAAGVVRAVARHRKDR